MISGATVNPFIRIGKTGIRGGWFHESDVAQETRDDVFAICSAGLGAALWIRLVDKSPYRPRDVIALFIRITRRCSIQSVYFHAIRTLYASQDTPERKFR